MITLDDPQMEDLSRIHHIVLFTDPLTQSLMLISRESSHNTVYQSGTEIILPGQPGFKLFPQFPQIRILKATFLQFFSVVVDQLAGQDDKSLQNRASGFFASAR